MSTARKFKRNMKRNNKLGNIVHIDAIDSNNAFKIDWKSVDLNKVKKMQNDPIAIKSMCTILNELEPLFKGQKLDVERSFVLGFTNPNDFVHYSVIITTEKQTCIATWNINTNQIQLGYLER